MTVENKNRGKINIARSCYISSQWERSCSFPTINELPFYRTLLFEAIQGSISCSRSLGCGNSNQESSDCGWLDDLISFVWRKSEIFLIRHWNYDTDTDVSFQETNKNEGWCMLSNDVTHVANTQWVFVPACLSISFSVCFYPAGWGI